MPQFPGIKDLQYFEVVFFDLDNTLYAYDPAHKTALDRALMHFAMQYDMTVENTLNLYKNARKEINHRLHGQAASHSRLLYFKEMIQALKNTRVLSEALKFEKLYWQYFLSEITINKEALKLIKQLERKGIRMGIITDLTTQIQLQKMKKLKIENYFEHLITSEEVGVEKPHPVIFNYALEKFNADAENCAIVGDNIKTDGGAEHVGIKCFLI